MSNRISVEEEVMYDRQWNVSRTIRILEEICQQLLISQQPTG